MTALKFIDIDGKRYLWRDIVKLRRRAMPRCRRRRAEAAAAVRVARGFSPGKRTQRRHPLSRTIAVFLKSGENRSGTVLLGLSLPLFQPTGVKP